jgi:hypothetical protein
MTLAEVGRAGQRVDLLHGGDVAPDGRLLSVQEIQQRFRDERVRRVASTEAARPSDDGISPRSDAAEPRRDGPASCAKTAKPDVHPDDVVGTVGIRPAAARPHSAVQADWIDEFATSSGLRLDLSWVRVLAGHSGAGASTTALEVADAAAAAGRQVQLVEAAHPSRSGLVAASSAELGLDESGAWRRGTRGQPALVGQVTIVRRASAAQPEAWPILDRQSTDGDRSDLGEVPARLVVVDLGSVPVDALDTVADLGCRAVVACRQTVSGVRLTEQLLDRLGTPHAVIAMLGPRRWPGEVESSAGPRLKAIRDAGRVVTVPVDRRLEITGPSCVPLRKPLLAAGRELLRALDSLDADHPVQVAA